MPDVSPQQVRVNQKIEDLKNEFGIALRNLLKDLNKTRLNNRGNLPPSPVVDKNSLRWTLVWQDGAINYDLNVVVAIEDDGKQARIGRVWVQRHATVAFNYEGHTPTTRMRRLTGFSLEEIRAAIEAEWM